MMLSRLIQKVRLGARRRTEPYLFLVNLLGYTPKWFTPYIKALRHKSVDGVGNERLEFLGDAVISLVVGDFLYQHFPQASEGQLTSYRSRLVCRGRLNKVAKQIGLHEHLDKTIPLRRNAENAYGNALEALVGAIYTADGYKRAQAFVSEYILDKNALRLCMPQKENDFKSKLLEWGQHQHKQVAFNPLGESYDSDNDQHTFIYEVRIGEQQIAQGAGRTKKAAQQQAAKAALHQLS